MRLSGILDFSMGNFLCVRGFAPFKKLSEISEPNPDVQRNLIEKHKGEMATFLNRGEYRFFPEVVLSVALGTQENSGDVEAFFQALLANMEWSSKRLGDYQISIFRHETGDKNRIAHLTFDESKIKLKRIDGNHRLSAADEVDSDFKVPFCLLLSRNKAEEEQYSRAIFHNINAKQIPLNLEENLRVILESTDVFTDEKLKTDPSFGWKYYLARKASERVCFEKYPFIHSLTGAAKYTYFLEEFELLLKNQLFSEHEDSVERFISELSGIEEALGEAKLRCVPQNMAVVGAISYYKLTDENKYWSFLHWAKENCITEAPEIHMGDLISIYDKIYENSPKYVFMSMQFGDKTEDTYQTVQDVANLLKSEDRIDLEIIKVDEHAEGCSGEIYQRITNGIQKAALVIADLSYGNRNVHHEIGYAQGLGKKVLIIYQKRDGVEAGNEIGSNLSMHDQLRFKNQTELRRELLKKIREFFKLNS